MTFETSHAAELSLQATGELPATGEWQTSRLEENRYRILSHETISELTFRELAGGPYVMRMDLSTYGRVYFVGNNESYGKLVNQGKTVRWLHDLFEGIRYDLIQKGLPCQTSIYRWTMGQIWAHQAALEVFPGAKVVRE